MREDSDEDGGGSSGSIDRLVRLTRPMGLGLTAGNVVSQVMAGTHLASLVSGAALEVGDRILRVDGIAVEDGCCPMVAALDYEAQVSPCGL